MRGAGGRQSALHGVLMQVPPAPEPGVIISLNIRDVSEGRGKRAIPASVGRYASVALVLAAVATTQPTAQAQAAAAHRDKADESWQGEDAPHLCAMRGREEPA